MLCRRRAGRRGRHGASSGWERRSSEAQPQPCAHPSDTSHENGEHAAAVSSRYTPLEGSCNRKLRTSSEYVGNSLWWGSLDEHPQPASSLTRNSRNSGAPVSALSTGRAVLVLVLWKPWSNGYLPSVTSHRFSPCRLLNCPGTTITITPHLDSTLPCDVTHHREEPLKTVGCGRS